MSTALVAPSVQDLLASTRRLLRQPDPNNSSWTDVDLLSWINEGIRIHFVELTDINEGNFATVGDLDIVSGSETVALPSDCFIVKAVYKKINNGYVSLPYRNVLNEGYLTQGGTSSDLYLPYYYFRGNSLVLHPVANFSETGGIRIEYYQMPAVLVDSSDQLSLQIAPIFSQVITAYAVYMAKLSESLTMGTDTSVVAERHFNGLHEQFKKLAGQRSKNPTFTVPFNPED